MCFRLRKGKEQVQQCLSGLESDPGNKVRGIRVFVCGFVR